MNSDRKIDIITPAKMAEFIDHTILKPEAVIGDLDKLCHEAATYGFKAVCINSGHVAYVADRLRDTGVVVCSVVGFPLGAMHTSVKAFEAEKAAADGAGELDMVLNIGALKSGDIKGAQEDIAAVKRAIGPSRLLKVIIETCLLTGDEKIRACEISKNAGADFVKTSTGFSSGGATETDVALMRRIVGSEMGVKASGGIKDWPTALAMIKAGANRLGTSSGVSIIKNAPE